MADMADDDELELPTAISDILHAGAVASAGKACGGAAQAAAEAEARGDPPAPSSPQDRPRPRARRKSKPA